MTEGRVLDAHIDDLHVLRFEGDIRYPLSPALDRFVTALFEELPQPSFVIDLTDTRTIDSTNLGLLARIAIRCRDRGAPRIIIVSSRHDINEVLLSMGFDEVFDIVEAAGAPLPEPSELPRRPNEEPSIALTMLEAHRSLMELSAHNREQFRDVVELLEQELAATEN